MTIHLRESNIDNLLTVARDLPADEIDLFNRLNAATYDPAAFAIWVLNAPGFNYILHNGDEPLAAAGFIPQRKGVYRTWMAARGLAWTHYADDVTRLVHDAIRDIISEGVAHRVETVTLADRNRARDWYQKIGLQFETTLRKYGCNGEDAVLYVAMRDAETN